MYPHGNRERGPLLSHSLCRGPYIKVKAVLALLRLRHPVEFLPVERSGGISWLRGYCAEGAAFPYTLPGNHILGRLQAEFPNGRSRIRDTLEYNYGGVLGRNALEQSSFHFYHGKFCGAGGQKQKGHNRKSSHIAKITKNGFLC